MTIRRLLTWIAGAATLALAACGGGGSSGGIGGTGGGGGGIGGTGVAYGTITAFGSVWVNGVEYSTGSTTFKTDDKPNGGGTQTDLHKGMVVRVDGSVSGKRADVITVDEAIKGFVEALPDANHMIVMGQTVQIDNSLADTRTYFAKAGVDDVRPVVGEYVHVYGSVAGPGIVAAGFVDTKAVAPSPRVFAVKGTVQNVTSSSMQIGTLTVQFGGADIADMPLSKTAWVGLQVDAKGTSCVAPEPACGTLVATKVEPAGAKVADAPEAEVEGIVSAVTASGFTIGNQVVATTASTRYEGGVFADIAVGTKLEAEGSIAGGVLTATKVSFRDSIRLEGDISTKDNAAGTLTLAGLPGVTVSVNSLTDYKGGPTFANLSAPNHLRIRGRPGAGNTVIATEMERRSTLGDSRVILQAPATSVAAPNLTLLGITVDTSSVSDNNFHDVTDAPIGRAAFFTAAKVGTLVKARGTNSAGTVTWDQMELEN